MIHTHRTLLSLSTALLLCFAALALAAPPDGKGGGKGGKGNQSVDAAACFASEISSNLTLHGSLVDSGGHDTLVGSIGNGETVTIGGDAGTALVALESPYSILPGTGVSYDPGCTANCLITFDEASGVTWTIRLDRDKLPENRVQLKMRWLNDAGLERHLRIGWVVQAYEDERYPLFDEDYGTSTANAEGVYSLQDTTVIFDRDLFRIDGDILVPRGKKMKTEHEVFSPYNAQHDDATPWCGMGGTNGSTCRESTTIQTHTGTDCV